MTQTMYGVPVAEIITAQVNKRYCPPQYIAATMPRDVRALSPQQVADLCPERFRTVQGTASGGVCWKPFSFDDPESYSFTVVDTHDRSVDCADLGDVLFAGTLDEVTAFVKDEVKRRADEAEAERVAAEERAAQAAKDKAEREEKDRVAAIEQQNRTIEAFEQSIEAARTRRAELEAKAPQA